MDEIKVEVVTTPPQRKLEVPEWVQAIKRKYLSQNISQFILHGNIGDLMRIVENGTPKYMKVKDFLNNEMFKQRDIVVYFDRAAGIRFKDDRIFGGEGKMRQDFVSTLKMFDELTGNNFSQLSREPERAFQILDTFFNLCVNQEFIQYLIGYMELRHKLESKPEPTVSKEENLDMVQRFMSKTIPDLLQPLYDAKSKVQGAVTDFQKLIAHLKNRLDKPKSIAFIIEYAETIIPMAGAAQSRSDERTLMVFLQKWATEDKFLSADLSIVVMTENIAEINEQYVKNPLTYEINLPYPDETERLSYINSYFEAQPDSRRLFEMSPEVLAKNTAGLKVVQLRILLSEATQNEITFTNKELVMKKKEMIESESGGLLEFIQTKYNLSSVAGHKHAKKNLLEAAAALKAGRPDVMPMGYLVSGPVGTGKTYLISCFANDIGVPMVMLKNFRSQWQGQTEGNLEKVLKILKAMSPVAVMIDEADAYLGNRSASGDSGVSSRVFSMIATFMSNTENRGKVVWFLITARPDLLPVDFKRQGRAEEHIALFYPESLEEKRELLQVCLKKTDLGYLDINEFDEEFFEDMTVKSGADMEAALTRAKFKAASLGIEKVSFDIITQVFNDFLPPTYPEEIELMNYSAILECTSKELLPEKFRSLSRGEVLAKVEELKRTIK
ncbi:MAG: ATP-binding protein [Bacteroidia bacterium]